MNAIHAHIPPPEPQTPDEPPPQPKPPLQPPPSPPDQTPPVEDPNTEKPVRDPPPDQVPNPKRYGAGASPPTMRSGRTHSSYWASLT